MRPLTLTTPKPLVRVHGERMLDSIIRALHQNGIREIHVVTGYLRECFAGLPEEFPGLHLIDNPWYASCNNISSLYAAREYLEDSIILDGDQIIRNPAVLSREFTRSGYNAVWRDGFTGEWLLRTDSDGIVTSCSRTGGSGGWQLYSVSRWTAEDGRKLKKHLEAEFEHGNRGIYWDDVALFCHPRDFRLGIREMAPEDVLEIDSLEELAAEDTAYRPLVPAPDPSLR